ncbi:MAG: restriction endonuclease [Chloroflexi bacterium]|nr:restriction endonuclease [Chloroflexota bacterium]
MAKKPTPKWKKFEQLVHKVQSALAPDSEVILDDRIIGSITGVERQIDISVKKAIGQFNVLIVVDCKDYKNPVDVKDVEEFIGLVEDVKANKGALVSAKGFTEAAKTRATNSGINLYRLVDAENKDWKSYVTIPMVCDFRSLGEGNFIVKSSSIKILQEISKQNPKLVPIYDQEYRQIGTPLLLLWSKWNKREISDDPGTYTSINLSTEPTFAKSIDGHYEQIKIEGKFDVIQKLFFGELPLTKVSGFRDEISGHLVLSGNSEIITDIINVIEVENTWPQNTVA